VIVVSTQENGVVPVDPVNHYKGVNGLRPCETHDGLIESSGIETDPTDVLGATTIDAFEVASGSRNRRVERDLGSGAQEHGGILRLGTGVRFKKVE
jgi:hypothetical protein